MGIIFIEEKKHGMSNKIHLENRVKLNMFLSNEWHAYPLAEGAGRRVQSKIARRMANCKANQIGSKYKCHSFN